VHLVVHDEDAGLLGHALLPSPQSPGVATPGLAAFKRTVNVLPSPLVLLARRVPPLLSMMARAIDRPRPSPRALVEDSGSMMRARTSGDMPTPVSATSTSTASSPARPTSRSVPPFGIASRALRIRLPKTMRT